MRVEAGHELYWVNAENIAFIKGYKNSPDDIEINFVGGGKLAIRQPVETVIYGSTVVNKSGSA
jgi:hypothetical protein